MMAIVLADLVEYAIHRTLHEVKWLWPIHAVHHSVEHMDWLADSRLHFLEPLVMRALQALPEGGQTDSVVGLRGPAAEIADHRHRRIRSGQQRPSRRAAAERRDELAPPQQIGRRPGPQRPGSGRLGAYFARFHTTTAGAPPADGAGLVHFSSSPLSVRLVRF